MTEAVVTLGCRLNLAESETIRGLIAGAERPTVVVNSCAVTAEAVAIAASTAAAANRDRRSSPPSSVDSTSGGPAALKLSLLVVLCVVLRMLMPAFATPEERSNRE